MYEQGIFQGIFGLHKTLPFFSLGGITPGKVLEISDAPG
jgi:hypothetical protein